MSCFSRFLSDKGSSLETSDLAFCNVVSSTPTFYSSARKVSHETKKISAPRRKFVLVMYATNIEIIITASSCMRQISKLILLYHHVCDKYRNYYYCIVRLGRLITPGGGWALNRNRGY